VNEEERLGIDGAVNTPELIENETYIFVRTSVFWIKTLAKKERDCLFFRGELYAAKERFCNNLKYL
jgi:hypothetical protein